MGQRFICSDPHLGQDSIYGFTDSAGALIRPWARSAEEGDQLFVDAWNATVHQKDTVYVLGDVAIRRRSLEILGRLHGRKILYRGNHDIFKLREYLAYFEDIRGAEPKGRVILSHYPVHPCSIPDWCHGNIHGHIHHHRVVIDGAGGAVPDPRYLNACVEVRGLAPVPLEEMIAQLIQQREASAIENSPCEK